MINVYDTKNMYKFLRDSYTGEGGYENQGEHESYLNPFPAEKLEYFNDRRLNTILDNVFQPMIDLYYHPIATQGYNVDVDTKNKDIQNLIEQTELITNANECVLDFIRYEFNMYSVSIPVIEVDSEESIKKDTSFASIDVVFPGDIKKVKYKGINVVSAEYKLYFDYEGMEIPIEVKYMSKEFTYKTLAWRGVGDKITLTDKGEGKRVTEFDGKRFGTLSKNGLKLNQKPSTFNLALTQLKMFNADSERRSTLRKNGFPTVIFSTDNEIEKVKTGNNSGIKISPDDEVSILEPDLNGVELIGDIMDADQEKIYKVWSNGLMSSNVVYNSATATAIASKGFKNKVNFYYNYYQLVINDILKSFLFIYEIETDIAPVKFEDLDLDTELM